MDTSTMPGTRTNHSAGDLTASAGGWTSLFNGGRRRPALLLPVHRSVQQSVWSIRQMPIGCVILEDIMHYALSNLHVIQKSLRYWESRARGSDSRQTCFMLLERGPSAFFQAARQGLSRLIMGSGSGPSPTVLGSAKDMIFSNIDALTSMERFFAAFLAELYREADIRKDELGGSRDESLRALFVVLDHVFIKLEELLITEDVARNPSEFHFERLPDVVGTESPQWTEELSTRGVSLIYQNLKELDKLVSSQLSSRRKPGNTTIYWLPYTCGAIGFSACSLWLLRHSSLTGSPDMGNWIGHAKESLAGFWNEKPSFSVGDKPFERTDRSLTGNQEARRPTENLFSAMEGFKIQKHGSAGIPDSVLELDQVVKANILDIQGAILELVPILQVTKILALGLPLLLLLSARARAMRVRHVEGRSRIARGLFVVEQTLLEFQECSYVGGKEHEACWKFGMALFSLYRLYQAVELYTDGRTEAWSNRFKEHVFHLAKPGLDEDDQRAALLRLKDMCDRLFTSPPSRGYRSILQ